MGKKIFTILHFKFLFIPMIIMVSLWVQKILISLCGCQADLSASTCSVMFMQSVDNDIQYIFVCIG